MKRIYTIGRDPQCDIIIQDVTDVVSRVHAVLKLESDGKMYIKDQSKNGTYINGMRVSPNVEIPVSRKDSISFANVAELDWSIIPNPLKKKMTILAFCALGVVVAGLLAWMILDKNKPAPQPQIIHKTDTIRGQRDTIRDTVYKEVPVKPKETAKPAKEKVKQKEESKPAKKDTVQVTGAEVAL